MACTDSQENNNHLQKSWSDPEGSRVQGFQGSSTMLNAFIWFQVQPKPFAMCLEICLFGKTIRNRGTRNDINVKVIPTLSDPARQPSRLVSSNESNSLTCGYGNILGPWTP